MGKGPVLLLAGVATLLLVAAMAFWVLRMGADYGEFVEGAREGPSDGASRTSWAEQPVAPGLSGDPEGAEPEPLSMLVAAPSAASSTPVAFSGRIVDPAGRPLPGASVLHLPSAAVREERGLAFRAFEALPDYGRLARTQSGADGRFALEVDDRPPSTPSVERGASHWADTEGLVPELLVTGPGLRATTFVCRGWTGGARDWGDLVVFPESGVSGRVVDEDGRPLAEVAIGVPPHWLGPRRDREDSTRSLIPLWRTSSDADGRFALGGLRPGPFKLEWRAPERSPLVLEPLLPEGGWLDLGDVALPRGPHIDGLVTDLQGRPLAGARVLARPPFRIFRGPDPLLLELTYKVASNDSVTEVETRTGPDGRFRLVGLPQGNGAAWDVLAIAPGFEPAKVTEVGPGGPSLSLALPPAATLLLTLVDATSGEPVQGATLKGRRHESDERNSQYALLDVITDPAALLAAGVPPPHAGVALLSPAGRVLNTVVVSAPGWATRGFVLGGVPPGERVTHVLKLPREARLHGRVLGDGGEPLAGASVRLKAPEKLRVPLYDRSTRADDEGRWAFDTLAGGDWVLTASAPGHVTGEPETVTVRREQVVEHDLVLQRGGRITGRVLRRGAPAAGVTVRARRPEDVPTEKEQFPGGKDAFHMLGPEHEARSDGDGAFVLDGLAPGEWVLDGPPGVEQPVQVVAGGSTTVELLARALPLLHGLVTDALGPVAGAGLFADERVGGLEGWVESGRSTGASDPRGAFELELPGPGRYRLSAGADGTRSAAVELEVGWDEVRRVDLAFGGGRLTGLVRDAASGLPLPGVSVSARWLDAGGPSQGGHLQCQATSGADGRFTLTRLHAGRWATSARREGYVAAPSVKLDVPAAGAAEMELALQPAGRVRVTLRPAPGAKLPVGLRVTFAPLDAPATGILQVNLSKGDTVLCDGLAAGRWSCEVAPLVPGDAPPLAGGEVQVVAGQTVELEMVLPE